MTDGGPRDPRDLGELDPIDAEIRDLADGLTDGLTSGARPRIDAPSAPMPDQAALARISLYQRKRPGAEGVRALALTYCPLATADRGPRLLAGVYVVDASVWLWLGGVRTAPSHADDHRRRTPPRARWLRDVNRPHPPDCDCPPIVAAVTCSCCRADRRITYRCTDTIEVDLFPRDTSGD